VSHQAWFCTLLHCLPNKSPQAPEPQGPMYCFIRAMPLVANAHTRPGPASPVRCVRASCVLRLLRGTQDARSKKRAGAGAARVRVPPLALAPGC
jgi:hypothetical protein